MGYKKQNSRKKAENGDFQVVGSLLYAHYPIYFFLLFEQYRLLARGSIAPPPLGNFADIPYLKEQFKLSRIRDVCTLSVGALSCNSLLHMLPKQN